MNQIILAHTLIAAVVGVMLFFSVAVAPGIFKVLPAEWAAKYVRAFFPKYYAVLGGVTAVAAYITVGMPARPVLWACAAVFALSLWPITPAINRARDTGAKRLFGALHGVSVLLNLVQLGALIWLLCVTPPA